MNICGSQSSLARMDKRRFGESGNRRRHETKSPVSAKEAQRSNRSSCACSSRPIAVLRSALWRRILLPAHAHNTALLRHRSHGWSPMVVFTTCLGFGRKKVSTLPMSEENKRSGDIRGKRYSQKLSRNFQYQFRRTNVCMSGSERIFDTFTPSLLIFEARDKERHKRAARKHCTISQ